MKERVVRVKVTKKILKNFHYCVDDCGKPYCFDCRKRLKLGKKAIRGISYEHDCWDGDEKDTLFCTVACKKYYESNLSWLSDVLGAY